MTAEAIFLRVLTLACDRLFMAPVMLKESLRNDATGTLFAISSRPETLAPLNPFLDADGKQHAISDVLTAARAYVRWLQNKEPAPSECSLPMV